MLKEIFAEKQISFCDEKKVRCEVTELADIVGYAVKTQGRVPINGLRHNPEGDTSGWYIWCGEDYSEEKDFFEPLHALHLGVRCTDIIKLLGLPAGYRFLSAGEFLDVWFDESLLDY